MSKKLLDKSKVLDFWNTNYDYNNIQSIVPKDDVFATFHSLYPDISESFFHNTSNELGVKTSRRRKKKFYLASVSSPTYPSRVAEQQKDYQPLKQRQDELQQQSESPDDMHLRHQQRKKKVQDSDIGGSNGSNRTTPDCWIANNTNCAIFVSCSGEAIDKFGVRDVVREKVARSLFSNQNDDEYPTVEKKEKQSFLRHENIKPHENLETVNNAELVEEASLVDAEENMSFIEEDETENDVETVEGEEQQDEDKDEEASELMTSIKVKGEQNEKLATPKEDCENTVKNDDAVASDGENLMSVQPDDEKEETNFPEIKSSSAKQSNSFRMELPHSARLDFEKKVWRNLEIKTRVVKKRKYLPKRWTTDVRSQLKALKYLRCCIGFKRHHVPLNGDPKFTCNFGCTIAGCKMQGRAVLHSNFQFVVQFTQTQVTHHRGKRRSFRAPRITCDEIKELGERLASVKMPSKLWNNGLKKLSKPDFESGLLRDMGVSKEVYKTIKHEYVKGKQLDVDVIASVRKQKAHYQAEDEGKTIKGFIQDIHIAPLSISMWSEEDIDYYHSVGNDTTMVVDATCGVAEKLNDQRIHYFALIMYNHGSKVKTEPIPVWQTLTDEPDEQALLSSLTLFRRDETRKFYGRERKPLVAVCDLSWPIIKALLQVYNKLSLPDYVSLTYRIVSGHATQSDFFSDNHLMTIYICLSHVMKLFAFHSRKYLKGEARTLIMFAASVLARSKTLNEFRQATENLFILLGSPLESIGTRRAKEWFDQKSQQFNDEDDDNIVSEEVLLEIPSDPGDPRNEDKYLQQCKRSQFYIMARTTRANVLSSFGNSKKDSKKNGPNGPKNPYQSLDLMSYILNNLMGLAGLWTQMMRGNISRHNSESLVYRKWNGMFGKFDCIRNPVKTQGIVERHNKSVKHIYLDTKNARIDCAISDLHGSNISVHRQLIIKKSRVKEIKLSQEKFKDQKKKKNRGEGFYQQPRVTPTAARPPEQLPQEWKNIPRLRWGGEVMVNQTRLYLTNTCTVDNILFRLALFFRDERNLLESYRYVEEEVYCNLRHIMALLEGGHYFSAKYTFLLLNYETSYMGYRREKDGRLVLDFHGTDKGLSVGPFQSMFERKYDSACTSSECPGKHGEVTLHGTNLILVRNSTNHIEEAITYWESGFDKKCPHFFDKEPTHLDKKYFYENPDHGTTENLITKYECRGRVQYKNLQFKRIPPFVMFLVSDEIISKVQTLRSLPTMVVLHGTQYYLGGCTVYTYIHYEAYFFNKNTRRFYYYDGCPSNNPKFTIIDDLRVIKDKIQLLIYFRSTIEHHVNTSLELSEDEADDVGNAEKESDPSEKEIESSGASREEVISGDSDSEGDNDAKTDVRNSDNTFSGHYLRRRSRIIPPRNSSFLYEMDSYNETDEEDKDYWNAIAQSLGPQPTQQMKRACDILREKYGYEFNEEGELRDINSKNRFVFDVHHEKDKNQERYNQITNVVTSFIYDLLEAEGKLVREVVPRNTTDTEGHTFVFRSNDFFSCETLVLLIHGAGRVRAGQWSTRLVVNHSLESGSQIPYVKKCRELGYGVLVLNTNANHDNGVPIRHNSTPDDHFQYIWNEFVLKSRCKHVAVVAHSRGGEVILNAGRTISTVREKVFAVALTDSVHRNTRGDNRFISWVKNSACNWVCSSEDIDHPLDSTDDCCRLSAGTLIHEETSWKAYSSVWKFIQSKFEARSEYNVKIRRLDNTLQEDDDKDDMGFGLL